MPAHTDIENKKLENQFLTEAGYIVGGVLAGGLIIFAGYKIIKRFLRRSEENESLDNNSAANYARRLKMAFDNDGWWGTDMEAVRKIFREIPSWEVYNEVIKSYSTQFNNRSLNVDLSDELTSSELQEIQSILNTKPQKGSNAPMFDPLAFAKRIHAAVNYTVMGWPATDEDAIRTVFMDIPSRSAWEQVKAAYMDEYGLDAEKELDDDVSSSDVDWRAMLSRKPM